MNIKELIEAAAEVAGSQVKLAALLDTTAPTLIQMKNGTRPCNWRVRGKLRAVLGEDPTRAFIAAMAEDLEQSENADEKKAADGFKAMLAAFPDNEESPVNPEINGASTTWRNRRDSNPR
ncbi:hypothetical protein ACSFBX_03725 [Variovorax sp. RB2P76]|uniref:hypothetical protein n=1 Tax=Variovorax sp. RB2P76 TaxID=3443736 RepID=UPI003F47D1A6